MPGAAGSSHWGSINWGSAPWLGAPWGSANWGTLTWSGRPNYTLAYDPTGRLHQFTGSTVNEQYLYDGTRLIAEYNNAGTILRRYVPGAGVDETLVWYEGANLSLRAFLHTDQQGSVIAATNSSAAAAAYAYSATGEQQGGFSSGGPIFRYTGQAQLAALGVYYYKARLYDPSLNRFLQTDPVGYDAGLNLYAYVGNDPVNNSDPSGLAQCEGIPPSPSATDDPNQPPSVAANETVTVSATCPKPGDPTPIQLPSQQPVVLPEGRGNPSGTNGGVCSVVGALGQSGRLRLGIDAAAGIGPFAKLGFGVSLRGDASVEFDLYFGGGAGLGLVGGAGLGLDNAGGQTRGGAFSVNQDASLSVGAGLVGFGVTKPFTSSYTQFQGQPTQYNGGFGFGPQIGPKLGIAGGVSAGTGNATYRTSGLCH